MPRALIVANGDLPRDSILMREVSGAEFVLGADGGANKLVQRGIIPHAVLGDFDSLVSDLPEQVERIPAPDQDATDLEKSVLYLKERGFSEIALIGTTGDRLDHTFGALGILCKYGLRLVDNVGTALSLKGPGEITLRTQSGQTVSLMPFGPVAGLFTTGLKWELYGESFDFAMRDGTSNVATGSELTVKIGAGYLVVYSHHTD